MACSVVLSLPRSIDVNQSQVIYHFIIISNTRFLCKCTVTATTDFQSGKLSVCRPWKTMFTIFAPTRTHSASICLTDYIWIHSALKWSRKFTSIQTPTIAIGYRFLQWIWNSFNFHSVLQFLSSQIDGLLFHSSVDPCQCRSWCRCRCIESPLHTYISIIS